MNGNKFNALQLKETSYYFLQSRDVGFIDSPRKFTLKEMEKYSKIKTFEFMLSEFEKINKLICDLIYTQDDSGNLTIDVKEYMKNRIDELYDELEKENT